MFVKEPAKESPLFGTPNFISTPHLGASTDEAQVNVAIQVAEQLSDYLVHGGVTNALNMPSLSAEEAPKLKPYMALAEQLGGLMGQLTTGSIPRISIHAEGAAAELNIKPIVAAVLAGFLRVQSDTVNMVNAPFLAKERGIEVREVKTEKAGDYHTLIRVSVKTDAGERSVAGTLFSNAEPRLVELFGIKVEAELAGHMLYVVNEDAPGFIGRIGVHEVVSVDEAFQRLVAAVLVLAPQPHRVPGAQIPGGGQRRSICRAGPHRHSRRAPRQPGRTDSRRPGEPRVNRRGAHRRGRVPGRAPVVAGAASRRASTPVGRRRTSPAGARRW